MVAQGPSLLILRRFGNITIDLLTSRLNHKPIDFYAFLTFGLQLHTINKSRWALQPLAVTFPRVAGKLLGKLTFKEGSTISGYLPRSDNYFQHLERI